MVSENDRFLCDLDLLLKEGVIGLFDHFELIEIARYKDKIPEPTNIFTIAVALENGKAEPPKTLNDRRIRLAGIKETSFGVFRSVVSADTLKLALRDYLSTRTWKPNGVSISVGNLVPISKQFVPPDGLTDVPLNRVLKNNFFNGSYILELFDTEKDSTRDFFNSTSTLQHLSRKVSEIVPLGIAALSDRLGNIIIQIPVEAIRADFGSSISGYTAEIAWHPKIAEREVIVTGSTEYDKSMISCGLGNVKSGLIPLYADPDYGVSQGFIWDPENEVILAATGEQVFMKTIVLNMESIEHEPRLIPKNIDDKDADVRVVLSHASRNSLVGNDGKNSPTESIRKRVYEEELSVLIEQRKFLQYGAQPLAGEGERRRALTDMRSLIASYGTNGVWLWDPFLAPQDILDTLFHNPTYNAPMRALGLLKVPTDSDDADLVKDQLRQAYNISLSRLSGNYHGLNVEFRSAHGPAGWSFHDRFLIFPKSEDDNAKVWSLGTSVNSLGKSHHILQQVEHAQLIADAFQSLWDAVDHSENLIWKWPQKLQ